MTEPKEQLSPLVKKELSRVRSELRQMKKQQKAIMNIKKDINAFTGIVSGNYWTQTGMPWVAGEGRKAVMTEYFWQPIRGQPRRVDTNELRQFSQDFWVSSCVKTIMDEIGSLDWDIVPKDNYKYAWVEKGVNEVKDFFKNPNKNGENFIDLIQAYVKDILEIDAGVIVKVFDINSYDFNEIEPKSGAPILKPFGQRHMTELYVRDGASFLVEMDKFGFVKGYWQYSYQIPAHPMWFNKEEISYCKEHPRSMSPYGYARTQAILEIVKSLHYSTLYNKKFFEETAIPDGALSLLDTNQAEMQEFMAYWNNEFKAQPHKVAVMNKEMKWQPFAVTNKELEFLDTQKWYFNIVISMFGLSPAELGVTTDLNRATSATQSELVKRKSIRPFLKRIEERFNMDIIPEFGYEGIKFQFIYDDPAEKKAKLDNWAVELSIGVKTVNEVRNEMGLEPISGGDSSQIQGQEPTQNEEGELEEPIEEQQSSGYKDQLRSSEAHNAERITRTEEERNESIQHPYSDNVRPTTVKGLKDYKKMSYEDLIAEHKKLVSVLESGDPEEIKAEAREQKKELEQYIAESEKSTNKGVDDGQYYRDQKITQPLRPSGAHFQPQAKLTDTALPSPWSSQNAHTDSAPAHLGDSHAKPTIDTWNSQKDQIKCPICGMNTLSYLNSMEQFQEDIRCTNCGARLRSSELMEAPLMEAMSNVLQANTSKSVKKKDIELTVKEYCNFDIDKTFPWAVKYADSKQYRALLRKYLGDLSNKKIEQIIEIIKKALQSGGSIRDVANKINLLVDDKARAELIARTEVVRVSNEGNVEHAKEKGVKKLEWLSAPEDGRLCSKCQALNGRIFDIDKVPNPSEIHPNCRCTTIEVQSHS